MFPKLKNVVVSILSYVILSTTTRFW